MKKILFIVSALALTMAAGTGCTGAKSGGDAGDTLRMKYAGRISIIEHDGYSKVVIADPWTEGRTLHTYILAQRSDKSLTDDSLKSIAPEATVVRTPLRKALITTSVHCALAGELGCAAAVGGVCDIRYISLPWVKEGVKDGSIRDCGSAMAPAIETIIDLAPDAIFLSPFQNSGGYGRIENLGVPIIEMADYMETSAMGRAEWMKFYGMLFGAEEKAQALFDKTDSAYCELKAKAAGNGEKSGGAKSVVMDKLVGAVWYVPGGGSTVGMMLRDAGYAYPWQDDASAGSLSLSLETVLEKASDADVWLFRYDSPQPMTRSVLLSENAGYAQFKAFKTGELYGCNTATSNFYEETPFHPERLLRDFITILRPGLGLGQPRYFVKVK